MSRDTEPQHPHPRPVIQPACQSVRQSLAETPALFTLLLLTCVCVCPCLSSGDGSGRSDSVARPSVSRQVKWHACQPS